MSKKNKAAEMIPPAWRVSADIVAGATFAKYRSRLIHETAAIQAFLSDTSFESFIISAPKGFGKTLLLIAKRLQLKEMSNEFALTDDGELIDRPADKFPIPSIEKMGEFKDGLEFWKQIWSYSIMVAAIKKHVRYLARISREEASQADDELKGHASFLDPWTQYVLFHKTLYNSPTSVFTSLLNLSFTEREKALRSIAHLANLVAGIHSQVAFFIDNVDEYFTSVLEDHHAAPALLKGTDNKQKSNDIWINAQLALISAAHSIQKNYRHIRVYCTIRHEAFLKLKERSEEYAQILGKTIVISYTQSDFKKIFEKNVALMPSKSLHANYSDAVSRFFGQESRALQHRLVTSTVEDAFEFVLRHTFYRPRDLMTICGEIALLKPEERTPANVIAKVDGATRHLVWTLHSEMLSFFRLPDLELLRRSITKNVLTHKDLVDIVADYERRLVENSGIAAEQWESDYRHPFCVLYQIGMLGWIVPPNKITDQDNQRFLKPDEIEVRRHLGLPQTQYYLIHPALDYLIYESVGGAYQANFYHDSVVGADLAWKEPLASVFAIKGDLCGFSVVMGTEFYKNVAVRIHEWAKASCGKIDFVEVSNGDSILLIDRSVDNLVEAVFGFVGRARAYHPNPLNFRFGGSSGPISYEDVPRRLKNRWQDHSLPLGIALRSSARIEPYAEPGTLLVDEAFSKAAGVSTAGKLRIESADPAMLPSLEHDAASNQFKLQKNASDPPYYTKLFTVRLIDRGNAFGISAEAPTSNPV